MKKTLPALFILIALTCKSFSQDSISLTEAARMRGLAVLVVSDGLTGLLNIISSLDVDPTETKMVISNSFQGTRNKIFLNADVNIEDDINPNLKNSNDPTDVKLVKYLDDLDILYTKSSGEGSIIISNVKPSNPKRARDNHIYIKVYYNCLFRNENKSVNKPYTINNRMASVRLEKKEKKWNALIEAISFFNPEDSLNDVVNDVKIYNENGQRFALNVSLSTDSASQANEYKELQKQMEAEELQKVKNDFDAENKRYFAIIDKGDIALTNKDYNAALALYKEAKDMHPYDALPSNKIANVNRQIAINALNNDKLFENNKNAAVIAEKKRNYQEASKLYKKAVFFKPEKGSEFDAKIKELDARWLIVSELQEKFEAAVNYKDLVQEYDKVLKKNKTNSDLYMGRGRCYEKLNNFQKALEDYTTAFTLDAGNIAALRLRADLYKIHNETFKALTDYKMYLTNDDIDPSIYESMADLRLRIKADNFDGAIEDINNGLKAISEITDPELKTKINISHLYYTKGMLQAQKKDLNGAIDNFSKSLLKDSSYALAHYNRGRIFLALGNVKKAAVDFVNAKKNGLDSQNTKNILAYAQDYFNLSVKQFNESAKDSAIILIDYAIDIDPQNKDYHFSRGEYYLSLGNNNEAINCFNNAIKLDNYHVEALYKRGIAYYNIKDYPTSIVNFNRVLELNNKHFLDRKSLADTYFTIKDYKQAAENYEKFFLIVKSIKNFSDPVLTSSAYNSMGKSYFRLNESDERALDAFKEAINKYANFAEAYFNKGLYYYKKNELSDAVTNISKALAIDGKHAQWNYFLAKAYLDKKDYQNAASNYNITLIKDSLHNYTDAVYFMGNANYQLQNYREALPNYLKAQSLSLDSSIQNLNYELGYIYLNVNKPDSALSVLQKAYLKDTVNGNIEYAIATSYFLSGKLDESLAWFEKAFQTKQVNHGFIRKDKLIEKLRDDKKFKALINKYYK